MRTHAVQFLRLCEEKQMDKCIIRLEKRNKFRGKSEKSRRNRLWILKVANQIEIAFLLFCLLCLSPFIIGLGKLISDTEWVETLWRSPWKPRGRAGRAMPRYETRSERWGWWWSWRLICHVIQREVIMSLVLAFHIPPSPTLSHYQCHLLLWLCFVYSTNDDLAGCLSSLLWVVSSNKHVFFINLSLLLLHCILSQFSFHYSFSFTKSPQSAGVK